MDKIGIYIVIFIIAVVVLTFAISYLKSLQYKKLVSFLEKKEFDKFDQEIDTLYTKILFPPFNVDYMKLNGAILRNDERLIDKSFAVFDNKRLNVKQKEAVYMMAFNYYISLEDYKKAKKYVDAVNTLNNEQMKKEANRIYNIYAEKGHRYLDEMLEEVNMMDDTYKGVHEFLIYLMYENKGDKENAEKYKKLSEKHMKLLDRKISTQNKEKAKKNKG